MQHDMLAAGAGATGTTPGPPSPDAIVDPRVRVAVLTGFSWAIGLAGVLWGTIYVLLGVPTAALFPYAFSVLTMANVAAYRRTRHFTPFAMISVALILVTPFGLTLHLGGFVASGAVGIWSSLAPLGAMMVLGPVSALAAFALFVATTVVGVSFDARPFGTVALPEVAVEAFTVLNVVGVSSVAFWIVRTFVATNAELQRQQRELRALEQAYLSQELLLRQQDRLATLGRLSAGVAHELNNPAAAAARAAEQLDRVMERIADSAVGLLGARLDPACLERIGAASDGEPPVDPLERSDRVDGLAQWLRGLDGIEPWEVAEALTELGYREGPLRAAAEPFQRAQVAATVRWIADTGRARGLLGEVRRSAARMSRIVRALGGYSHMDRAAVGPVDLAAGLDDTLVILRGQLGGVEVRREIEPDLPEVVGNAGELNQVWTNLIANAAQALGGSGTIVLRLSRDPGGVRLEVEDDGPGIPDDVQERVFDPFVTTKGPGEGTGLGLNLAHRTITEGHGGSISVTSRPGCTRFVVTLPAGGREAGR